MAKRAEARDASSSSPSCTSPHTGRRRRLRRGRCSGNVRTRGRRGYQGHQALVVNGAEGTVQKLLYLQALAIRGAGLLDLQGHLVGVGGVGPPSPRK